MPSPTKRFCTATHKIKVIDRFLRNAGECKLMIIQGGKSIAQIARESEEEERFLHADDFKDLYKETSKKTYCGLFCHR